MSWLEKMLIIRVNQDLGMVSVRINYGVTSAPFTWLGRYGAWSFWNGGCKGGFLPGMHVGGTTDTV